MSGTPHPENGPGDADVDRAFNEIVAGLRRDGAAPRGKAVNPPWPPERSLPQRPVEEPPTGGPTAGGPASGRPPAAGPPAPPTPRSHLGPGTPEGMATDHRSYEPPEEDDHFVPPPPPPLPAGDLHFWSIVVGLVVGPLLVVLSAIVPLLGQVWTTIGLVLTVVGFVLLVLRQPRRRHPYDGDDGARV